jgi:hypothetical protein
MVDGFGVSEYNTCTLTNSEAKLIELAPRTISTAILIGSMIYLYRKVSSSYSKLMWNFYLILFFVILTWSMPGTMKSLLVEKNKKEIIAIGYFLGTLSGTCVGLARLIDGKIYREIIKKFLPAARRKAYTYLKKRFIYKGNRNSDSLSKVMVEQELNYQRSESVNCFSDLFAHMSKKVILR